MRRYILLIEATGHPEARREVVVEARDDGDAYDQAADHAAAELPYHCTFAISEREDIASVVAHEPMVPAPVLGKIDTLRGRRL